MNKDNIKSSNQKESLESIFKINTVTPKKPGRFKEVPFTKYPKPETRKQKS